MIAGERGPAYLALTPLLILGWQVVDLLSGCDRRAWFDLMRRVPVSTCRPGRHAADSFGCVASFRRNARNGALADCAPQESGCDRR